MLGLCMHLLNHLFEQFFRCNETLEFRTEIFLLSFLNSGPYVLSLSVFERKNGVIFCFAEFCLFMWLWGSGKNTYITLWPFWNFNEFKSSSTLRPDKDHNKAYSSLWTQHTHRDKGLKESVSPAVSYNSFSLIYIGILLLLLPSQVYQNQSGRRIASQLFIVDTKYLVILPIIFLT